MKKIIILILLAVTLPWLAAAQKNKIVTIEATGEVPYTEEKSVKDIKREALNEAILNGLQEKFYEPIFKGDKSSGTNVEKGGEPKTSQNYTWFAGTLVKGEVIEILQERYKEEILPPSETGRNVPEKVYRCTVKFTAREVSESKPEFDAYPLFSPDKKSQTSNFVHNDTLYLYFKTPSTGFLSVYLDDGAICQQLLPFKWMGPESEDGVKLEADKEYILFCPKNNLNYYNTKGKSDYITVFTEKAMELNRLIVIFSKSPVTKPTLKEGLGMENPTEADLKNLPKASYSKEFEEWRIKMQSRTKDMAVSTFLITIKKKDAE